MHQLIDIFRQFVRVINGTGLFPSEKDKHIADMAQAHADAIDDFMRLFSWIMYIEDKYDTYHADGPIKELFEQIWTGDDSPYDKLISGDMT